MKTPIIDFVRGAFVACALFAALTASGGPEKPSVAILKFGSHALIDEVERSVKAGLAARFGNQVSIDTFNANFQGKILEESAAQIATGHYNVVVPITTSATNAAVNTSPVGQAIVFSFVSSPESVWGKDKPRPPNVTGTSDQIDYAKNLGLIRRLFPKATRVGYLVNEGENNAKDGYRIVRELAPKYGLTIVQAPIGDAGEVSQAAKTIVDRVDVFLVGGDNTVVSGIGGLLSVAERAGVPVIASERTSVEKGCVAGFGIDYTQLGDETVTLIADVLNGIKPADLAVVYLRETKLFVNQKALEAFKLKPPPDTFKTY